MLARRSRTANRASARRHPPAAVPSLRARRRPRGVTRGHGHRAIRHARWRYSPHGADPVIVMAQCRSHRAVRRLGLLTLHRDPSGRRAVFRPGRLARRLRRLPRCGTPGRGGAGRFCLRLGSPEAHAGRDPRGRTSVAGRLSRVAQPATFLLRGHACRGAALCLGVDGLDHRHRSDLRAGDPRGDARAGRHRRGFLHALGAVVAWRRAEWAPGGGADGLDAGSARPTAGGGGHRARAADDQAAIRAALSPLARPDGALACFPDGLPDGACCNRGVLGRVRHGDLARLPADPVGRGRAISCDRQRRHPADSIRAVLRASGDRTGSARLGAACGLRRRDPAGGPAVVAAPPGSAGGGARCRGHRRGLSHHALCLDLRHAGARDRRTVSRARRATGWLAGGRENPADRRLPECGRGSVDSDASVDLPRRLAADPRLRLAA